MKRFVLNADDLAKSEFHNNAVLEGLKYGLLKSTSVMTNMPFYKDALHRVIMPNPELATGIHLNIVEGKALNQNLNMLCDKNGNFNNNYLSLILKSYDKKFITQVETEFRSQIELALKSFKPTHIDSHVHTHAIPNIFKITAKLAVEYNIPQIRTQAEAPYFVKGKNLKKYLINILKSLLLNHFTLKNKAVLKEYNLTTNDYLIGILYTGMMDSETVLEGINAVKIDGAIEALIHPCLYYEEMQNSHTKEFEITKDKMLKDLIENQNIQITNYLP